MSHCTNSYISLGTDTCAGNCTLDVQMYRKLIGRIQVYIKKSNNKKTHLFYNDKNYIMVMVRDKQLFTHLS